MIDSDGYIPIISIISYYARQIFNGTKLFEFRKSPLNANFLNRKIYVYSAKEDKAIIGTMKVSQILHGSLDEILQATNLKTKLERDEIVRYFGSNNQNCYALRLSDVKRFQRPIPLYQLRKIDPAIELPQYFDLLKNPRVCQFIRSNESYAPSGSQRSFE